MESMRALMAPTETNSLVVILPHAQLCVTKCTILRLWPDKWLSLLLRTGLSVELFTLVGELPRKVDSMNFVNPGENMVQFLRIRPTEETKLLLETAPAIQFRVLV